MADSLQGESADTPMDPNFDYMFKTLIVGNSGVGKTAFLVRYTEDTYVSTFVSTVGIDFKVKTLTRNDKRIKLQIWDTAGQERYKTITTAYYRGAMGFIVMFDLTNEESFKAVQSWTTTIRDMSWANARMVLVGNKCDLTSARVISSEQAKAVADTLGMDYFETSAKDNINITRTFDALVDKISEKMAESIEKNPNFQRPKNSRVLSESDGQNNNGSGSCSC